MIKFTWMGKACAMLLLWAAAAIAAPAQTFTTLVNFDGTNGSQPEGALVQYTDGNLYGPTSGGGATGAGSLFEVTPGGVLTTVQSFSDVVGGYEPVAGLTLATNGDLYGTTASGGAGACDGGCGTIFKITPGGELTTLLSFDGTNGSYPEATLVQGTDGHFYGTTLGGGLAGFGTFFRFTPSGTLKTLYNFKIADGIEPQGTLVQGSDGDFYGTTSYGGGHSVGTVFKITPTGTLTTLYSFCSQSDCADGTNPLGGVIQASDGNFYGVTSTSGSTNDYAGTVFKITSSGSLTTLYSFCSEPNCADGDGTWGGLIQGTDGTLYGTTTNGGAYSCPLSGGGGCGTVFGITLGGTLTTLHSFDGTDGYLDKAAALIQGTSGFFYGTTRYGGANTPCTVYYDFSGCGTIFSLNVGLGQFVETLPISGKVGGTVKILGSFLTGATSVTFNGTAATFTVNSKSEIITTVPTGATTGTVQVISPRLGTLSSNVPFTVRP